MCAVNVEKTVAAWVKESEIEAKIRGHKIALQRLVEKVSIFSQAVDQSDQLMGPEVASRFAEYSSLVRFGCYPMTGGVLALTHALLVL
ncbi:hypothetical protein P43SY_011082 [Pythium insidiosum]|uniref:Uncharacterized protein n=1 Tax=Pythium insidiosum TaxID=114742 RepID=A0AAD5LNW0_PYTIN|nr:hypothetical protein P43SY_011082 [Pythium insidiosum]